MDNHKLKTDNVVSIGHNSNRSATAEALQLIKEQIRSIIKKLDEASSKHTASHGNDYYFDDEICNQKDIDKYGYRPEWGNTRRPNPYEKKMFARDTETLITECKVNLYKEVSEIVKLQKGDDNE